MKYGLIGERLTHSFSREVHTLLCGYDYELCEIPESELEAFFTNRDFSGINVTIPYKTSVIKYLDRIDDAAEQIGAVNTVVNRNGKLYGYNTDAFGLSSLIQKNSIDLSNKKVLILGGGGTSKTAAFAAKKMGAGSILKVSRTKKPGFITYDEAKAFNTDTEVIINTTPVGMFPDIDNRPVDISQFEQLEAVIDVIYNPLKSRIVLSAEKKGIPAAGGLYMLVAQAYKSAELFLNGKIDIYRAQSVYEQLLKEKQNVVLIGMPSSGKTTVGKMVAEMLDMPFFDSDEQITEKTGSSPARIIKERGEAAFRAIESKVLYELSLKNHCVIATGGGAPAVDKNVFLLKSNGIVYYLDRPINLLKPTADRPLSSSKSALLSLYNTRRAIYNAAADLRIINDTDALTAAKKIKEDFLL